LVTNVNIPNRGQISNYPLGAVVETNAELSGTGIRPLTADPLPPEIDAFIMKHVYHHEAFIRAANKCDANAVKYIISDDPQCAAVSFEQLNRLFDEMYNNTKDYLDFYWHK
jgi:alpha-galactosidase